MSASNITISIGSINVTINGEAQGNPMAALFSALAGADVHVHSFGTSDEKADTATGTTAAAPGAEAETTSTFTGDVAMPTAAASVDTAGTVSLVDAVAAHLKADTRWKLRTVNGVATDSPIVALNVSAEDVAEALEALVNKGLVKRKTRRSDDADLYGLIPLPGSVTVTTGDIKAFLRSNNRFGKRSFSAFQRFFEGADAAQLQQAVEEAVRTGEIRTERGRRTQTTYYKA